MKKHIYLPVSALFLLLSSTSAFAMMDAKTFATKMYENQKKSITAQGATITENGSLTVTDQGKYASVTYPALTIQDSKMKVQIDPIHMNLMPDPNGKEWKMTIGIPSPIKMSSPDGKDLVNFTIGTQNLSAVVEEATLFPRVINAVYKDIRLTSPSDNTAMILDSMTMNMNYTPDAQGLLSGPFAFHADKLSFEEKKEATAAGNADHFKIGSFNVEGEVQKMDTAMMNTFNTKMAELTDAGLDTDKIKSPESMSALWKIVMEHGIQQMDGLKAKVAIRDISAAKTDPKDQSTESFKLDEVGYRFDTAGLRNDKSDSNFTLVLNGLNASEIPAEFTKFIPTTVNLSFGYRNLPHKELMKQLGTMAEHGMAAQQDAAGSDCAKDKKADCAAAAAAQSAQMMAMQTMMTIPAILAEAGTVFTINNTEIGTTDYNMTMNGDFTAAKEAVYGGTGAVKTVFTGLDQLVVNLTTLSKKPDLNPETASKITQALQGLAMVQMLGQQGTGAAQKPARIYDVAVDAAGAVKLNGTDLATLMGPKEGQPGGDTAPTALAPTEEAPAPQAPSK